MSHLQKHVTIVIALLVVACLMLGCGGGGGGTSGVPSGGPGITQLEAVVSGSPTSLVDPTNIMAGDFVVFEAAHYDSNGVRTVVAAGPWTTDDTGLLAGILDSTSGLLTAVTQTGATVYTATTVVGGSTYHIGYKVTPYQARLNGRIRDINSGVGIAGIKVLFYNVTPALVGQVTTQSDGTFSASVPTSAVSFNLDPLSIPTTAYYRTFSYKAHRYAPTIATCTALVPAGLSVGATTVLPADVFLDPTSSVPPGPPDGCGS